MNNSDAGPYLVYKDVLVGQTKTTPELLSLLISNNEFKTIIEIGTHRGGLSLWLNDNKPANCSFTTIDITAEHLKIDLIKEHVNFLLGDCFTDNKNTLINLIKNEGQTLLLCDGGNKEEEFKTFAPFLKVNDVIMCHDFADDMETYYSVQSSIKWPSGPESFMSNLASAANLNNLLPYFFEDAKRCFWGCFKKL